MLNLLGKYDKSWTQETWKLPLLMETLWSHLINSLALRVDSKVTWADQDVIYIVDEVGPD